MTPESHFTGQYFATPDAPAQDVQVTLQPNGLALTFPGSAQHPIFWLASDIHPHAYRKGDLTIFTYGPEPLQRLEVISPTFADAARKKYPSAVFHQNALSAAQPKRSALYLLVLLVVGGLLAAYFLVLPALSGVLVQLLPPSAEVALGQKLYEQMVPASKIDSARSLPANQFLRALAIEADYPLQVTVVKDEKVNAFALPGGHMVIYTGLLDSLQTPEEFAALLGHEFAHAQNRHSLKSLARNFSTYLLVSLVFSDVTGLAAVLLENADKLESLSYSRALEEEADTQAYILLKEKALNPQGLQRLFERLQKAQPTGTDLTPPLLQTHPLTAERLQHLQELRRKHPYPFRKNPGLQKVWGQLQHQNSDVNTHQ
ncbi:M48 family metallopeptidase [Rufibacter sp. LB8]|uniref:M48 family metallopeptidase n=1 Tax=Rufibacter sp. LB8 TaxID=2777781 RepID=UPI00178C60A8|nr:M48 family metallopeptidase [Rufibacter sp. LB8]